MNPVSIAEYPDPWFNTLNASIDPDTALPDTLAFVATGMYDDVVNFVFAEASTVYMYFQTYPSEVVNVPTADASLGWTVDGLPLLLNRHL